MSMWIANSYNEQLSMMQISQLCNSVLNSIILILNPTMYEVEKATVVEKMIWLKEVDRFQSKFNYYTWTF